MIRAGFAFENITEGWLGGVNYYRNLFNALLSLNNRRIEPVVFMGEKVDAAVFKGFPKVETVRTALLDNDGVKRKLREADMVFTHSDRMLEKLLSSRGIGLLSHSGFLGKNSSIPAAGWIADFQHMRMPGFFSKKELAVRDRHYGDICKYCETVIVSSGSALKDLREFAPGCEEKASVLRFVADIGPEAFRVEKNELEAKYKLRGPYFHLPNQFWAHKNHMAVLEALSVLKSGGREVKVVATGNTKDYRQPGHFERLMEFVAQKGISDNFIVLGIVPREDLWALMRHSIAVLNPSLFEGWSSTVEETKSMGKRVVLSDIPVHREQAPPGGVYFPPDEPEALAEALWRTSTLSDPVKDSILMDRAATELPGRLSAFGREYEEIALRTMER